MGLFFFMMLIAHDHHTRPFNQEEYDGTYCWVTFFMPPAAFGVSVWTIFAFSYALIYRGNDRYGFIPIADREHSFWNTIDVVSARVGTCFDEALVSFDSS